MKTLGPGFRNELLILYYAVRHRSVPLLPKMVAGLSLLYLLVPAAVVQESRLRARGQKRRFQRVAWAALLLFILLMSAIYWYFHTHP